MTLRLSSRCNGVPLSHSSRTIIAAGSSSFPAKSSAVKGPFNLTTRPFQLVRHP